MRFVGLDLTSAFARGPRAVDVAILDDGLHVAFGQMHWPSSDAVTCRDVVALRAMLNNCLPGQHDDVIWAVDGPQGLAQCGKHMRCCERQLGTPGRTPAALPPHKSQAPFQGYIRASIDFFAAMLASTPGLRLAGAHGATICDATLFEVFPGSDWQVLAGCRLIGKNSREGREARRQLFEHLRVQGLPALPSADQNDALAGAYLAWCTRNMPERVRLVGERPIVVPDDELREGYILRATSFPTFPRWSPVSACPSSSARGPTDSPPCVESPEDDWSGDALLLKLTDTGLVHGQEAENGWLVPQCNYVVETRLPNRQLRIMLTWAPQFSGGRGWKAQPKVREVLASVGSDIEMPSKMNPLSLPVSIVS